MAELSIALLGGFTVTLGGEAVRGFSSNKERALLAYLAVEMRHIHQRDSLATLLWPGYPGRSARANLRGALAGLRTAISDRDAIPPFLNITRDTIQFNTSSDHSLDVAKLEGALASVRHLSTDELMAAADLVRGELLAGFSLTDALAFDDWESATRERVRRQALDLMGQLVERLDAQGDRELAIAYARRRVDLAPYLEGAQLQLIHLLADDGQRAAALSQYEACRAVLAQEFKAEPSASLRQLHARIRDAKLGTDGYVSLLALPPGKRVGPVESTEVEPPLFVARERELARLHGHLRQALGSHGHVVLVSGEAGAGKTALIQALAQEALGDHADLIPACGTCNAHTGTGDPYGPFREIIGMLTGHVEAHAASATLSGDGVAARVDRAFAKIVHAVLSEGRDLVDTLVAGSQLLRRAERYALEAAASRADARAWLETLRAEISHSQRRRVLDLSQGDLFRQVTAVLKAIARHAPLLLILDDLHWADVGSLRLLGHLGAHLADSAVLIVGAYRSEEAARRWDGDRHPLEAIVNELTRAWGDISIDLADSDSTAFVDALLDSEPNSLDADFRRALVRQTQGHALYTVELLHAMQDRGDLQRDALGRWTARPVLVWDQLPARVEAVIGERIGRLDPELQELLRVASVEGNTFTAEVVADVLDRRPIEVVRTLSQDLDRHHRIVHAQGFQRAGGQPLSRYRFRHALFQRYLYGGLDYVERAHLHGRVGAALLKAHGGEDGIAGEVVPQLARHAEESGALSSAADYYRQAAEHAVRLSAFPEARGLLRRALALLDGLRVDDTRDRMELELQSALAVVMFRIHTVGDAQEAEAHYRALALAQSMGDVPRQVLALHMIEGYHQMRGEHHRSREIADQLYALAQESDDPGLIIVGHLGSLVATLMSGDFVACLAQAQEVLERFDPVTHRDLARQLGQDPTVVAQATSVYPLWYLGYPDRAARAAQDALARAAHSDDPFLLQVPLSFAARLHRWRGEPDEVLHLAQREQSLGQEQEVSLAAICGELDAAWHLAQRGQCEEGIRRYTAALGAWEAAGSVCRLPEFWTVLAEMHAEAGHQDRALRCVSDALARIDETDERYHEAEAYRVRGKILLDSGRADDAEADLRHAIDLARAREHRAIELRAVCSLSRLLVSQDRDLAEAQRTLSAIYGWFTEGHDTRDLVDARSLLDELATRLSS